MRQTQTDLCGYQNHTGGSQSHRSLQPIILVQHVVYPILFTDMQWSKLAARSCYMMKASLLTTLISLLWRTSLVTYFNNLFKNTTRSYWKKKKKVLAQLGLGWEVAIPGQPKCFRLTFGFSNIFWKENCWQGCESCGATGLIRNGSSVCFLRFLLALKLLCLNASKTKTSLYSTGYSQMKCQGLT